MSEHPVSTTPAEGLRRYVPTLRRHWPLALAIVAVAAIAGYAMASMSAPSYEATAKVLLDQQRQVDALMGASEFSPDPERDVNTSLQLVTLQPIASSVRRTLGIRESWSSLVSRVSTKVDANSSLVSITVRDASAQRAARLANAFAAAYRDFRSRSAQSAVDDAIASAEVRLRRLAPGDERTALSKELRRLQVAGAFQTGGVQVVHPATAAAATRHPSPKLSAIIGGLIGLVLAAVAIVVLARTDKRVRSERELEAATGRPILARVPASPAGARDAIATLALSLPPSSAGVTSRSTLMLTSPGRDEGTAAVALGLAQALDAIGEIAIAVETDLRDPAFADALGLGECEGLVGVLSGTAEVDRELVFLGGGCALPAGRAQALPQPLLASDRMSALVDELANDADVVLLSGAPVGVFGDALALVGLADAVVLVASPGVTRVDELERAMSALRAAGAAPVGVVMTTRRRRRPLRTALHRLGAAIRNRTGKGGPAGEPAQGAAGTTTEVPVA